MNIVEEALLFTCAGEVLPGIIARPAHLLAASTAVGSANPAQSGREHPPRLADAAVTSGKESSCGVLIVVGGPQYRVGSHRQFLLLSRRLASEGYPVMRFDYRGMGDGGGTMRSFEDVSADIGAAIDAFQHHCPSVQRIVLWGLCDAASAALLYVEATRDRRVVGLALLNPWLRSEASLAQTHIKHYYGQRLLQREFWWKLCSGRMQVWHSLCGLLHSALLARRSGQTGGAVATRSFQERMAAGWRQFPGRMLLILSAEDYTAKEFLEFAAADPGWSGLIEASKVRRIEITDADHTFSSRALRSAVEDATLTWLHTLPAA
jgi:exosortase A-associated hydrolase 1